MIKYENERKLMNAYKILILYDVYNLYIFLVAVIFKKFQLY